MKVSAPILKQIVWEVAYWKPCAGLLAIMLSSATLGAGIIKDSKPFALNLEQLSQWSAQQAGSTNISLIPLAERFVDTRSQLNPNLNPGIKVLVAPDGINNLGNYIGEQSQFNLYNFTHWSHVDILNWFAGTADLPVNIPAAPWVDAAHRNGVKVIGTVFFAPIDWGGSEDSVAKWVQRSPDGSFPLAYKLIQIAEHYGFDGWLINQETSLEGKEGENAEWAAAIGKKIVSFMSYLMRIRPDGMEIHWYDSMLPDGRVRWQNELNDQNVVFLQNGTEATSDGIFLNYWWDTAAIESSRMMAESVNRSRFDVYTGADLWPARKQQRAIYNTQWLHDLFPNGERYPLTSLALFANNYNYSYEGSEEIAAFSAFRLDPNDVRSFYDAEVELFAGEDQNLQVNDGKEKWAGIGRYVPAKSTLMTAPFVTSFNTGHGKIIASRGQQKKYSWHDMSRQDVMPSWQFAIDGNASTKVAFDFDRAYEGGSSLRIWSDLSQGDALIPLYKTKILLKEHNEIAVIIQSLQDVDALQLMLELDYTQWVSLPLNGKSNGWQKYQFDLADFKGKTLTKIAFGLEKNQSVTQFVVNVGLLEVLTTL